MTKIFAKYKYSIPWLFYFIIPKRDRPCSLTLQPHHYVCESDSPFDNRSFVKLHKKQGGAHNFSSIESRMHTISTWLVFLSFLVCTLQRLYREMCFDLLGPLSIVFYNFGVYNNVSAASNLGSDGSNNTTWFVCFCFDCCYYYCSPLVSKS